MLVVLMIVFMMLVVLMIIVLMLVVMVIVVLMIVVLMMISSNQPKPLTGETQPALRQEINARLSLSPGLVLAAKINGLRGGIPPGKRQNDM